MITVDLAEQPCYCTVCDQPASIIVQWSHEKPGYHHIKGSEAYCPDHAQILRHLMARVLSKPKVASL